jgi:hypothetical protein
VPHFLESLDFARPPSKGSVGSGLPIKVLEGASRLGTYILLRLTALRPRESPHSLAKNVIQTAKVEGSGIIFP